MLLTLHEQSKAQQQEKATDNATFGLHFAITQLDHNDRVL